MDTASLYEIFLANPVVTTDSRDCPPGSMFFALKGESFDGNKFAAAALEKGCAYAVVDDSSLFALHPSLASRFILVDDCLRALQLLARHHRRQFRGPVIGITGTNGKTTTKELVAAVLSKKYNVLFTQGNFNNDIGVPKTLLRLDPSHDIAVIEMGASHPGDIKTLVEIVEPDSGIITNVGRAHLQGFGSLEGVVSTKGELFDYLRTKSDSVAFVDGGNALLTGISNGLNLIKYGTDDTADNAVVGRVVSCAPCLSFEWKTNGTSWHRVDTRLIGSYNIYNMLAAVSIGLYYGVTAEQACHALAEYTPTNNRSQLEHTAHNHLIIDTYNANPTSMEAAIRNFRDMEVSPKMAILGDMRELGDCSLEEHRRIVSLLKTMPFDTVWLVGEEFAKVPSPFRHFNNVDEVKAELALHRPDGQYILIKGSNGVKLFQLPELL